MRQQFTNRRARRRLAWGVAVVPFMAVIGCGPATSGSNGTASVIPANDETAAPKGNAIAEPMLREARDEAEALLRGLLAGEFDQDENLALVAEKLKGYTSWSIKAQTLAGKGTAEFKGTLSGPAGKRNFSMLLVKQAAGKWAVGTFSGPN